MKIIVDNQIYYITEIIASEMISFMKNINNADANDILNSASKCRHYIKLMINSDKYEYSICQNCCQLFKRDKYLNKWIEIDKLIED